MGDERERVGEIEVFACWGSWLVGHGAMRGTGVRYEKDGERVADLVLKTSWQHDGTVFESGRRAATESLSVYQSVLPPGRVSLGIFSRSWHIDGAKIRYDPYLK